MSHIRLPFLFIWLFKWLFAVIAGFSFTSLHAKTKRSYANLEATLSPFIITTKQIQIPDYPHAFNPALVRWKDGFLMGCRVIINETKKGWHSYVAVVTLDQNFNPTAPLQLLDTRSMAREQPANSADPRLIWVGDRLYVIYSDTLNLEKDNGIVRMWVALLTEENGTFSLSTPERLSHFPGSRMRIEKNWIPFSYEDQLLLAYHVTPHRIFRPFLDDSGRCEQICATQVTSRWQWGEYRGGTPALRLNEPDGDYLAFFHSPVAMSSLQSQGKSSLHYFMGAYLFSGEPPFSILKMSPTPIIGKGFYTGQQYMHYWRPVNAVFPSGLIIEENYIILAYGRQDHELWVAKIDKKKLLDSLEPVTSHEQRAR